MWRTGRAGPFDVTVSKTVGLNREAGASRLEILYELENLPTNVPLHFGVEFNFAGMAAGAADRYYYDARGDKLGQLESVLDLRDTDRISLIDEWLGLDVALESSFPGGIWTFPIQTISQSESGFEAVHQSCCVVPHWDIVSPPEGKWSVQLTLSLDTSAAQARRLRDAAVMA